MAAFAVSDDAEDYIDPDDSVMIGEAVLVSLRPAGWAMRAGGAAIDVIIYAGAYIGLLLLIIGFRVLDGAGTAVESAVSVVLLVMCLIVAPLIVEVASHGKSAGRAALGTRIVRDDGGAIGVRHALIRSLVGFLELFATFGGLAAIVGLLNRRSKRLGDLLAGTYSQYERVRVEAPAVFGVPLALTAWAQVADVARMPAGLSRRIAHFLKHAPEFIPQRRTLLAQSLASEAAAWVSPVPDADPELFLAAVAVMRREREARAIRHEGDTLERLRPVLDALPHGFPDRG